MGAGRHQSSVWESLCFALCTTVAVLSSVALKLPPRHPLSPPVKGLPSVWKLFLIHSSLPEVQVLSLFVCVFPFFFWPSQVRGEFLAFWEVWGLLPAFSRCSVGVVPQVDVFLMYLWGGRWSPRLTPPPSWRSPLHQCFIIWFPLCQLPSYLFIYLFIYFWLCRVFVAAHGLSLVAVNGGYSSLWYMGFSLWWLLLLWRMGSRHVGFSSCGMRAQ